MTLINSYYGDPSIARREVYLHILTNTKLETLNPKPRNISSNPQSSDPKPETLIRKPQTVDQAIELYEKCILKCDVVDGNAVHNRLLVRFLNLELGTRNLKLEPHRLRLNDASKPISTTPTTISVVDGNAVHNRLWF